MGIGIETNSEAVVKHEETLGKLLENHDLLVLVAERQQTVIKRLDTINGTVQDYNQNKYRIDIAESSIGSICEQLTKLPEKFIDTKSFKLALKLLGILGTILGVIISASIVLNLFKII